MSEARRTNITISESLYRKAQELMRLRDFGDFSGYIQQLIREDWEERGEAIRERFAQDADDLRAKLQVARDPGVRADLERRLLAISQALPGDWTLNDATAAPPPPPAPAKEVTYSKPKRVAKLPPDKKN
jgi:Arc/MetJ-type ribon-helix-helix transcriptional regulator